MVSVNSFANFDWDDGYAMPVANSSNKKLEQEIRSKQKEILRLKNGLSHDADRSNNLRLHMKHVKQELHHTQELINARKAENESVKHMVKMSEREQGRLNQEVNRIQKDDEDNAEKKKIIENRIYQQKSKAEEMKSQMKWNKQALDAWLEESTRQDQDALMLMKYTRQDVSKINELQLKIQNLTEEKQKKRLKLDSAVTNTHLNQIELDKTAADFRTAHEERQNLINQWESVIVQMQRRDKEMELLNGQLADVKSEINDRDGTIREKQQFLENEIENNEEQEKKISISERTSERQRIQLKEAESQKDQFQNELEALKRTVDRTATDLESMRSHVSHLKKDVIVKQEKLEEAKSGNGDLVSKLQYYTDSSLNAEEKAMHMEELLKVEELRQKQMESQMKVLRDTQFQGTQKLHVQMTDEKNTEALIQGSQAEVRNLASKMTKLDHESLKQQEILYNQEFTIQQLESRINRMQGEQSNEEKLQLEEKSNVLNSELDEKITSRNLLKNQLKCLQEDLRRVQRNLEKRADEKTNLTSKIDELMLHNDNSERELKLTVNEKQKFLVDENILKMEMKRLKQSLECKADDVMSLETRKLQLDTAIKERRCELSIHKEMLDAQLKAVNEEKQKVSSEVHERISKASKLQNRYEILTVSMAPPEGEEEKSQAYYVIKAAQEKEELQREGDELDAKIKKAEKETFALENTVKMLNNRNETFRKSFSKVSDNSSENEEKRQLEEQHRALIDKCKYKKRQIKELQEDLLSMKNTLDGLVQDENSFSDLVDEKQNLIKRISQEIEECRSKLTRAENQITKYVKDIRSSQKSEDATPNEIDIDIRAAREFNKLMTKQIGEAVHQHVDIQNAVHLFFSQSNLPPPVMPGFATSIKSSRSSSFHSSISNSPQGSARSSSNSSARSSLSGSVISKHSQKSVAAVNIGLDMALAGSPVGSRKSSSRSSKK